MIRKLGICAVLAAVVSGPIAEPAQAETDIWSLVLIAKKQLASVQKGSFQGNREYCGMIGRTAAGELIASPARRGRTNGCDARGFDDKSVKPVASYHTHGGYDPNADSEVPSISDMDMDMHDQVVGFVATPGGRLWIVDPNARMVKQVCGIGCLPKDPRFRSGTAGPIPKSLTRKQLSKRQGAGGPKYLRSRAEKAGKAEKG